MERVYIETTIVSYLTSWPSRDLIIAAHQQITKDWWEHQSKQYELCASQLVIQEASAGDPLAAQERMNVLAKITLLEITSGALGLAKELMKAGALPKKAEEDALHIAIAATQNVPYLLTWNCRHMLNATMRPLIERTCKDNGFTAPIICSPEEMTGE